MARGLKRGPKKRNPWNNAVVGDATFVVGADIANVVNVAIQLLDDNGNDLTQRVTLYAYLSDDPAGDTPIVTAHSGAVAIGTDGTLRVLEAKKQFMVTCEADGDIDINITEAGAKTAYLHLVLPDGTIKSSTVITHGA